MKNEKVDYVIYLLVTTINYKPCYGSSGRLEVRRLKDGTCGVKKIKPGAKPGDRVGGPYKSESKARQNLQRLKSTPRCKRF